MALKYMPGIHADIAEAKYKYWSMFAPNPVEVVLAAGEKAKAEAGNINYFRISRVPFLSFSTVSLENKFGLLNFREFYSTW